MGDRWKTFKLCMNHEWDEVKPLFIREVSSQKIREVVISRLRKPREHSSQLL